MDSLSLFSEPQYIDGHITSTVGKCTIYEKDLGIDHTSYVETVLLKRLLGRSEIGLDQKMNKERNEKHRGFILHGQKIWKTKLEEHRRELIHERMYVCVVVFF